jgi:hypothetical protein
MGGYFSKNKKMNIMNMQNFEDNEKLIKEENEEKSEDEYLHNLFLRIYIVEMKKQQSIRTID